MEDLINMIAGAGAGTVGTGALSLWLLKRWMAHTDKRIDKLEETISKFGKAAGELHTSLAVSQERQSHLTGRLDQATRSYEQVTKDVAKLHSSVEKLWLVLKSKDLVPTRFSDEATSPR